MFNGHPPFAYEHTDGRQDSDMDSYGRKTPPAGFPYHEFPYNGFPPHPIPAPLATLDRDEVVLHRMTLREAVPALNRTTPADLLPAKIAELTLR
ncbi:hypothetical protein LTR56_026421, partial [Elasticomyces elasticus]